LYVLYKYGELSKKRKALSSSEFPNIVVMASAEYGTKAFVGEIATKVLPVLSVHPTLTHDHQ
jgi:hypothetical protein